MLKYIASVVDQKAVRGTLIATLFLTYPILGLPALFLINDSFSRDPALLALGICGLAGMVGAAARLRLGSRYFLSTKKSKFFILSCLGLGSSAAFVAALLATFIAPPELMFLAWASSVAGLLGLLLVVASIEPGA
ncbi:MAG: hypothetical protein EOP50_16875 [Sphingobacteriales bacterium]|nr:MAG: hypothetical protein EOP50_16875 [Sphingobacteriales bacterium]